jgi:hypothetical protein
MPPTLLICTMAKPDFLLERYRRARAEHFMVAGFRIIARGKMLSADDKIRTECVAFSLRLMRTYAYARRASICERAVTLHAEQGWLIMFIQKGASCSSRSKLNYEYSSKTAGDAIFIISYSTPSARVIIAVPSPPLLVLLLR